MSSTKPIGQLEELAMAVRAWTTRDLQDSESGHEDSSDQQPRRLWRSYPTEALIFDTETLPDLEQRLRLLVWRFYRDAPGMAPGHFCVEEGIAYPDALPERDPDGFQMLLSYAEAAPPGTSPGARPELLLRPLSWWLQERLFAYGYRHRDRCLVVGFNLPFDLAAVASHWGEAKGYYLGGFSLGLWGEYDEGGIWADRKFHPRLMMKAIDPRRTLFGWGKLKREDADRRGGHKNLLDLRTLAFALTDRSLTLEGACGAFGVPYKKIDVDLSVMSPELIDYAREDVEHTALLYRATMAELARHPGVELPAAQLYSPASVGVHYLEAMGLQRSLEKFTRLSAKQLGWPSRRLRRPRGRQVDQGLLGQAMSAFYGGRAEARLIRLPVQVVHVDFTSMYPAINSLLGTWPIIRAQRLRILDETEKVRALLAAPDLLERCLRQATWRKIGVTLVEVEPDGDILPTRAAYDPAGLDFGIGVNPLHYEGRLWYALPDLLAARLLNLDKPLRVLRALRLAPRGKQPGLETVRLRGGIELDPSGDRDPYLTMIEQRHRVREDPRLSEEERERLQLFLKITANGTSYGSLARFDRRERSEPEDLLVHGPDPDPRRWKLRTPEDPGPYCFPPVAASITAGARLMLALLESLVTEAGGTYAFMDTDSMAIVAAERAHKIGYRDGEVERSVPVLDHDSVRSILERFEALNPYDPELLEPWKVEYESLDRPLWCYAISSKRYCLYRLRSEGRVEIVSAEDLEDARDEEQLADWSEHGLGAYMDPSGRAPEDQRDEKGRRIWIREAWEWIIGNALGHQVEMPDWAGRPALTRFTVSSPRLARWFQHAKVRPGSFGLLAHADRAFYGQDRDDFAEKAVPMPAAPYEQDPAKWMDLEWHDRHSGKPVRLVTLSGRCDHETLAQGGAVVVETMARVLGRYIRRPEHKSLAQDGSPAGPATVGLLQRRAVHSPRDNTRLIGKEGNQLVERVTGQVVGAGEYRNDYGTLADPWERALERLREIGAAEIIRRTGFSRSAVYAVLGGAMPHPRNRSVYVSVARLGRPT